MLEHTDYPSFQCQKCSSTEFNQDTIRTTGSGLSRLFNVQNKKFTAISCKQCGFTEFYNKKASAAGNVLDFLLGG